VLGARRRAAGAERVVRQRHPAVERTVQGGNCGRGRGRRLGAAGALSATGRERARLRATRSVRSSSSHSSAWPSTTATTCRESFPAWPTDARGQSRTASSGWSRSIPIRRPTDGGRNGESKADAPRTDDVLGAPSNALHGRRQGVRTEVPRPSRPIAGLSYVSSSRCRGRACRLRGSVRGGGRAPPAS